MAYSDKQLDDIARKQAALIKTLEEELVFLGVIENTFSGVAPAAFEILQMIMGRPRVSSRFEYLNSKALTLIHDFLYTGESLGDELMYAEGARGTIQFLKDIQSGKVRHRLEEQLQHYKDQRGENK